MGLFGFKKKLGEDPLQAIVGSLSGWYTNESFSNVLKRERNRSSRTGLPISYILIDLSQYADSDTGIKEKDYYYFLRKLVSLINGNTRDFDIKHLISPYKIGILLVDTSLDGAKAFIDKISRVLFEYFESDNKEKHIKIIESVIISSFPSEQISDCSAIKATPVVVKDLRFKNDLKTTRVKTSFQQNSDFFMDWRIVSANNGNMTIADPIVIGSISSSNSQEIYHLLKRIMDVVGASLGLLLFSPLIFLICVLIKITSRGPILFKQKRIGQFGKPFTFLKFRSMKDGCDHEIHQRYVEKLIKGQDETANLGTEDNPIYKLQFDPRVTAIGHFLRKTSLDEIPQFINVLIGDMSLVGPRPPILYEVENYKSWHLRRILETKPGITGFWQIYGRSKTTFDEMVRLDLQYVDKQSIALDTKITMKTIKAILTPKNGAV